MTASQETPTNPADENVTTPAGNEPNKPEPSKTPAEPETKSEPPKEPEPKSQIKDPDAYVKAQLDAKERVYQKKQKELEEKLNASNQILEKMKGVFGIDKEKDPEQTAKEAETLRSKMVELEQDKKLILKLTGRGDIHPGALDDVISKINRDSVNFDSMDGIDTEIERIKESKPFLFVSKEEKQQTQTTSTGLKPPVNTDPLSEFTATEIESAKAAGIHNPENQVKYLRAQKNMSQRYNKKKE